MNRSSTWFIAAALLLAGACNPTDAKSDEKSKSAKEEPKVLVRVMNPTRGKLSSRLEITGVVEAHERADVFPKLEGTVARIVKVEGEVVKEGDVLAELACEENLIEMRGKELALEQAKLAVKQSQWSAQEMAKQVEGRASTFEREKRQFERSKEQRAADVVTDQDLELAEYNYTKALADLEATKISSSKAEEDMRVAETRAKEAEATLDAAKLKCEWMKIRATISGCITQRHLKQGQKASPAMAAYSIVDLESLVVKPAIPQKELRHLRVGLPVKLSSTAWPDVAFTGNLEFIWPEVDTQSGTIAVRIRIDRSEPALLPGMFVSGNIVTSERDDLLLVPKKALLFERERPYVYLVRPDGEDRVAIKTYIERGLEDDSVVEYRPPVGREVEISEESEVVLVGMDRLNDGSKVEIENRKSPESMPTSKPAAEGER